MTALLPKGLVTLAAIEPDEVWAGDVLVLGSGAAGLTVALGCAPRRTTVLTAGRFGAGGSTAWAQGGVAAALGADDAPELHAADTVEAGAGLVDPEVAGFLARGGPGAIRRLLELGARFDRDRAGNLALGREAAHSRCRIVHARGDATGAEITRVLTRAVRQAPGIRVVEGATAVDLVLEPLARGGWRVAGVVAVVGEGGGQRRVVHLAAAVVLATGGLGGAYLYTTNPPGVRGDGLAMAARAGARLVDLEFVQFHPTALLAPGAGGGGQLPLLTEALRGEGAVLVDDTGDRFMLREHPDAELAPRDVVARAIWRRVQSGRAVYLDAREAVGERFPRRFPTVFESCRSRGIDPRRQPMPVSPAAHYHMGGVAVDERGRSSLPGLWACGEVASTGAHGANRLASNSLLEALVFGGRVAEDVRHRLAPVPDRPTAMTSGRWLTPAPAAPGLYRLRAETEREQEIRHLLWSRVGLVRRGSELAAALAELDRLGSAAGEPTPTLGERNLLLVARLLTAAALAREESRGGHFREDFPTPACDGGWHLVLEGAGGPRPVLHRVPMPGTPVLPELQPAAARSSSSGE